MRDDRNRRNTRGANPNARRPGDQPVQNGRRTVEPGTDGERDL